MSDAQQATTAISEAPTPSLTEAPGTLEVEPPQSGADAKSLLDTKTPAPVVEPPAEPTTATFDANKLTLAEGFEKNELYNDFVAWAAEKNISQEMGQELIDFWTKGAKSNAAATETAWREQNETWQAEVKADPDIGGSKLPGVLQTISKVLDNPKYFPPEIRQTLAITGIGNNRDFIKGFYQICADLTEGRSIAGNAPGIQGRPLSIAERIYPDAPRS
jgi:hypothetical protein